MVKKTDTPSPQCGCPVSPETVDIKETKVKSSKKKVIIILAIIIIIVAIGVILGLLAINKIKETKEREEAAYKSNMENAVVTMSTGIDKAEDVTHFIRDM